MIIRKLLFIFFSFSGFLFAQTKEDVQVITKDYDLGKLKTLQNLYEKKETEEKKTAYEAAKRNGWPITIKGEDGSFQELMKLTPDGFPIYYSTHNVAAARSTRTNFLNAGGGLGLSLDGEGMVARVWDGGTVRRTHNGFGGRVTTVDDLSGINYNDHATHVTGTIIAAPWNGLSAEIKGMAKNATARTFNWNNDESEAVSEVLNGMLVSNHSYGVPIGSGGSTLPAWIIGAYIEDSRIWDEITFSAPYYLPVISAGNDGANNNNPNPITQGTDKLIGNKTAKNTLIVANAQDATIASDGSLFSVIINSSSSQGPTDDRRIKPDITGNGTDLTSTVSTSSTLTNSNIATDTYSGTSMASPNVAGTLLLLQQHFKNVTSGFMKSSTLRGLVCHTADDAGDTGPDVRFGWGLLNAKKAAETISGNGLTSWISEEKLNQGQTNTMTVKSAGGVNNPLVISITWTDLPGIANNGDLGDNNSTPVLINDLDIRVTRNGSTVYYPWRLQSGPNSPALRNGDNFVDNIEVVRIDNPSAGDYVITVSHKGNLVTGSQNYSLIATGITSGFSLIPTSENVQLCNNQTATYTFSYKQSISGTTNFSAVGVPSGANVSISPSSLSANGIVTMTVSNLSSLTPGDYSIGIVGNNGTETETRTRFLKIYSSTFEPTTLTSPLDGLNGTLTSLSLNWESNPNAENYRIQVSTSSTFGTLVVNELTTDLNYIVSGLNEDTIYYWRVIPSNRCGVAPSSSVTVNNFRTGVVVCDNIFTATDFSNATIDVVENSTASVPIVVTGGITIADLNVTLDISHTWIGDMIITLTGPIEIGSPEIVLFYQPCIGNDSTYPDIQATLDDSGGAITCSTTSPVVSGVLEPIESLALVNGLVADGTWLLNVLDVGNQDGGIINSVTLNFCKVIPSVLSTTDNIFNSLKVYPNPAKGIVNIDLAGSVSGETVYELFDVQGRKVISKVSSNTVETLNIENLSGGIYLLTIENSGAKTTKKLIIN
ncbi:S8 family serine peptidase [Flavobacterium cucumis]|uniref:Por secretion system C-terminal sorting domain-containing protein n=1 Tax=Flavobacterium cucumis TaxID=416016 RepID=A0A1M7ZU17_9FLAO|nr:S8 family serine peptidase [Flavobacterium cucumis]SHO72391.1 Por secretion system C-terminal sorting domain-containing protein [Flavobacterium cucumis]